MQKTEIQSTQCSDSTRRRTLLVAGAAAAVLLATIAPDCLAAPTGAEDFASIYDRLLGWTGGTLGKALALAFLVVGLLSGLLRGSLLAAITCIGAGIALVSIPSILNALFTAT